MRPTVGSSCHSDRADAGLASIRPGQQPSRADREQEGGSLFFVQLPANFRGRWPRARGGRTAFPRSCGARGKRQEATR
ncbi:unnamed protein product [Ectocarpus fasciculatus]